MKFQNGFDQRDLIAVLKAARCRVGCEVEGQPVEVRPTIARIDHATDCVRIHPAITTSLLLGRKVEHQQRDQATEMRFSVLRKPARSAACVWRARLPSVRVRVAPIGPGRVAGGVGPRRQGWLLRDRSAISRVPIKEL